MSNKIMIYNPSRYNDEVWLPMFWSGAKTYYEAYGDKKDDWEWIPSYADFYATDIEKVKELILEYKPDILGISLYIWNISIALKVAEWVKETMPDCLIISGGPQQNLIFNNNWFNDHPFIDASLPGENYGELCIKQILDGYNNGKVDWSSVSDMRYPMGKDRMVMSSKHQLSLKEKKAFDYDWPVYAKQEDLIFKFQAYKKEHFPRSRLLGIFETTRGCPYKCSYCDWGGGIGTAILKKSLDSVSHDLNLLCKLDLTVIYMADANIGIFGVRDVKVHQMLIEYKNLYNSRFKMGYGGFAKTKNRLPEIVTIVAQDLEHELSNSTDLKISIQSFDETILENIDRKNIDYDLQLAAFEPLSRQNRIPLYVELIFGLPGMTMDVFYKEVDIIGKDKLSVMWYEWLLLPGTPAYDPAYREKFKIGTITKNTGWRSNEYDDDREIVASTYSYSTDDYVEMLLASSLYNAIVQGGYFNKSIDWVMKKHNIKMGDLIRQYFNEVFDFNDIKDDWDAVVNNPKVPCHFRIEHKNLKDFRVYAGFYIVLSAALNRDGFNDKFSKWLHNRFNVPFYYRMFDKWNIRPIKNNSEATQMVNDFMAYNNTRRAMIRFSF